MSVAGRVMSVVSSAMLRHGARIALVSLCLILAASMHMQVWEQLPPFPWFSTDTAAGTGARTGWPASPISPLCHAQLHDINWTEMRSFPAPESEVTWSRVATSQACQYERVTKEKAGALLRGKRVRVSGDSQSRFFFIALLKWVLPDDREFVRAIKGLKRHSDYTHVWRQQQTVFHFDWAPYSRNLSDAIADVAETHLYPDLVVLGAGLWHMLHVTNPRDYEESLQELRQAAATMILNASRVAHVRVPQTFWLNIPTLIRKLLNTEDKRVRMTEKMCRLYDAGLRRSQVLQPHGPAMLVDLRRLTSDCGPDCTEDGMHYSDATYHAAVQIVLNAFQILHP